MSKNYKSFGEIEEELSQEIERRQLEARLPVYLKKSVIIPVVLCLIVGFVVITLANRKISFTSIEELPAKSALEYQFKWTEENFSELGHHSESSSDDINAILERFGRPSSSQRITILGEPGLEMTYDKGAFSGEPNKVVVTLTFLGTSNPTLLSKSFYGLPIPPYIATSPVSHRWTKAEFQALNVGSISAGIGGDDLDTILGKYGHPVAYETSGYHDDRSIRLNYTDAKVSNGVYLLFDKMGESGDYRLVHKEWVDDFRQ